MYLGNIYILVISLLNKINKVRKLGLGFKLFEINDSCKFIIIIEAIHMLNVPSLKFQVVTFREKKPRIRGSFYVTILNV